MRFLEAGKAKGHREPVPIRGLTNICSCGHLRTMKGHYGDAYRFHARPLTGNRPENPLLPDPLRDPREHYGTALHD